MLRIIRRWLRRRALARALGALARLDGGSGHSRGTIDVKAVLDRWSVH